MQTEKKSQKKKDVLLCKYMTLLDTKQTPCGPFGWDGTIRTFG